MKRILAVILSVFLVLGASPALAEDYVDSDGAYWTPFDYTITVDGAEAAAEPGYNGYIYLYRYTSIADALGYQTSFNAETGKVESVKGDLTVSFSTSDGGITLIQGEITNTDYFRATTIHDKTYISYTNAKKLASYVDFALFADENLGTVSIYTPAGKYALAERTDARLTQLNAMLGLTKDKNYTSQGTSKMAMNFSSKLFGLSGTGDMHLETVSAKDGDKTYAKITASNSGLMNLFRMFHMQNGEIPADDTMEFFTDGQQIYFKNKALAKSLLTEYDYAFTYRYTKQVDEVADKWFYSDVLSSSYQLLLNKSISMGGFLVDYCFENAAYATDPIAMIDMLTTLFSDENITVTEKNGLKTYTYKLNKNTFLNCMEPLLSEMSEEERTEFDSVMDAFNLEMTASQAISADGIISASNGKITLSNVPNPWNEDVFSGEILFTAEENAKFAETIEFAFPDVSDAVNLTEYAQSVIDADIFEY